MWEGSPSATGPGGLAGSFPNALRVCESGCEEGGVGGVMAAQVLQVLLSEIQNHVPALSVYVEPSAGARDCGWNSDKTAEHALLEERATAIGDLATTLGVRFTVPKADVLEEVSIGLQAQVASFIDACIAVSQSLDLELQKALLDCAGCVLGCVSVFVGYLLTVLPSCGDEGEDGDAEEEDDDSDEDEDEDVEVSDLDESFGRLSGFNAELLLLDCDRQRVQREVEGITEACECVAELCLTWKEMFQQKCKRAFDEMTECMKLVGGSPESSKADSASCASMLALQGAHCLVEKAVDICEFLMDVDFDVSAEVDAESSTSADTLCRRLCHRLSDLRKKAGEYCAFFAFIDVASPKSVEETLPELAARGPDLVALFEDVVADCAAPVIVVGDEDFGRNVLQESASGLQKLLAFSSSADAIRAAK